MKILSATILSAGIALFLVETAQSLELNIETGKGVSGKKIQSNTVSEGQVVINGKVVKGATRKMTPAEERRLEQKLERNERQLEREMENMEYKLENMFD